MKTLPHSPESEAALLGSLIIEPKLLGDAHSRVKPEMFYDEPNKLIYQALLKCYMKSAGQAIDLVLVRNELTSIGKLETVGGVAYLKKLAESVPSSANWYYYAKIVKTHANERTMIASAERLIERLYDPQESEKDKVDAFEQALLETRPGTHHDITLVGSDITSRLMVFEQRTKKQELPGISTGFRKIDECFGGWQNGRLYIIGARPSMGKSSLIQNSLESAATDGIPSLVFSLEAAKYVWQDRMLGSQSKVSSDQIRLGALGTKNWEALYSAAGAISDMPIYLADVPDLTPAKILTDTITYKQRYGIKLVAIDYLQLMSSGKKFNNREGEVASISRDLKLLARQVDLPVIVLSQLSRRCEERADKRPISSDLRESGSLEQDADGIMLIYRDDFYTQTKNPTNITEVLITKNKDGMVGKVELIADLKCFRFENKV